MFKHQIFTLKYESGEEQEKNSFGSLKFINILDV